MVVAASEGGGRRGGGLVVQIASTSRSNGSSGFRGGSWAAAAEEYKEGEETFVGDEEALQGCLTELTEELSALKFALGGLDEKFLR